MMTKNLTVPNKKLAISKKKIAPKFQDAFVRFFRYMIFFGGRGGSKSTHIAILLLARMMVDEYMYLIFCRKWSAHIKDSQFKIFQDVVKMMGWQSEFKFNQSDYSFICLRSGNRAVAKGLDDNNKTKSIAEPTHIWGEEMDQMTFDDFDTLNKSLRSPKTQNCFIMSFNTFITEGHWIRTTIFDKIDLYQLSEQFRNLDTYLNHSTYLDNPFINQEEYRQTLLMDNGGNEAKIESDLKGLWGEEPNDDPWLYAFNEEKHVREIPFIPSYPIYLTFDFNKNPMTVKMMQMSPQKGLSNSFIHMIDEMEGNVVLREFCERIKAKYPFSPFFVTGDSSGNKEGEVGYESKHDSAYSMIKKHLGLSDAQMNPNGYNLSHENSRILMNQMFYNYPNLFIHPQCKKTINECKIARINPKGSVHELLKDREKFMMDHFDNMRYFFQKYFQEFARSNYHRTTTN
ncbi:phage terminase large subunit [Chryseobacterium viscerum]|uniref:Phage terminase large subunit N-terminal domain-containing protein n=1 Tax=Chryseobacterium viscerum TaxID=1037377 RepID=A0A5N4BJ41_9FLAO|nr:phage terminase large subunit [Chryseobacterium viscerum]KAB1228460.1 hypothetical protein F8D52_22555 [Chryseobacterium viscerum]